MERRCSSARPVVPSETQLKVKEQPDDLPNGLAKSGPVFELTKQQALDIPMDYRDNTCQS